ncbi:hypothetical protein GQ54DRAFT_125739 [Martensiomyces pterosporus]|nr:hypothetical protein GQ54DRAFT_125739 [Martensiomyces pterosporus]
MRIRLAPFSAVPGCPSAASKERCTWCWYKVYVPLALHASASLLSRVSGQLRYIACAADRRGGVAAWMQSAESSGAFFVNDICRSLSPPDCVMPRQLHTGTQHMGCAFCSLLTPL